MSSEPQEESVREQIPEARGTVVLNEEDKELCGQIRPLDITWKPQLQLHVIVLPQDWVSEEDNYCNQQRTFRVEQDNTELPQTKEETKEPELPIKEEQVEPVSPRIKEELEGLCISQDEEQLDLKQETYLMEIPVYEENEHSEADLNNQLIFNATDCQEEEGSNHEESTSTTDEETDPQNRSYVQYVDSSCMSESQFDSVRKTVKGKSFGDWSQIRIQTKTQMGEKPFPCKECDTSFSDASNLKRHMRTHTGEKPFSCKVCYRSFSQISHLKRHTRTHTGEKPFSCEECHRSFSHDCNLKTHMKTHTGEKTFFCKECGTSFSRKYNLKKHMRTHTGEKPFACEECNTSFFQIYDLKRHMRIHTGEKPFSCKECDRSFSQISSLKRHMKTHRREAFSLERM